MRCFSGCTTYVRNPQKTAGSLKTVKPVRASGSRWVAHKLAAMKRVLSKFGAYTGHLGTCFELIDEMLLRLYYLCEKSPKKCRELEDIISDLKECLCFDDAGVKTVHASGSRWVAHKLAAMKRVLSKFGAYTGHLAALSEDSSVKAADCAKLSGYYKKLIDAKYILGCAVIVDLLTPCTIFSITCLFA